MGEIRSQRATPLHGEVLLPVDVMILSKKLDSLLDKAHHLDMNMEIVWQFPRILSSRRIPPGEHGLVKLPNPRAKVFHGLVEDLQKRTFSEGFLWLSLGSVAGGHHRILDRITGKLNVLPCSAEHLLVDASVGIHALPCIEDIRKKGSRTIPSKNAEDLNSRCSGVERDRIADGLVPFDSFPGLGSRIEEGRSLCLGDQLEKT